MPTHEPDSGSCEPRSRSSARRGCTVSPLFDSAFSVRFRPRNESPTVLCHRRRRLADMCSACSESSRPPIQGELGDGQVKELVVGRFNMLDSKWDLYHRFLADTVLLPNKSRRVFTTPTRQRERLAVLCDKLLLKEVGRTREKASKRCRRTAI